MALMVSSATATAAQQGGCRRRGTTLFPDVCRGSCRPFSAVSSPMDVLSSALRDDEDGHSLVSTLFIPFMPCTVTMARGEKKKSGKVRLRDDFDMMGEPTPLAEREKCERERVQDPH